MSEPEPQPIEPRDAVKMYLNEREPEVADKTLTNLRQHLGHFTEWCDKHGRAPLFTTRYGRVSPSAIKDACYTMTRPCVWGSCPHNRDPDECEAADDTSASLCPSSVSPHPVRRGSITHHLLKDVPETAVSDRCDVSEDVLEHHYDQRTEHEKAEQRREYIDRL